MVSVGSMAGLCMLHVSPVFDGGFWMANERFLMFFFF